MMLSLSLICMQWISRGLFMFLLCGHVSESKPTSDANAAMLEKVVFITAVHPVQVAIQAADGEERIEKRQFRRGIRLHQEVMGGGGGRATGERHPMPTTPLPKRGRGYEKRQAEENKEVPPKHLLPTARPPSRWSKVKFTLLEVAIFVMLVVNIGVLGFLLRCCNEMHSNTDMQLKEMKRSAVKYTGVNPDSD